MVKKRITFEDLQKRGLRVNLVIERINRAYERNRYRYSVYDNDSFIDAICENIGEVRVEIERKEEASHVNA